MKNAKKVIALLLAVLTFVSVATFGVSAADETTTPPASTTSSVLAKIVAENCTKKLSGDKIEIAANDAKATEIKASAGTAEWTAEAPVVVADGIATVTYNAFHFTTKEDGTTEVVNKAEAKVNIDGKDYVVSFVFKGEDEKAHRYNEKVGDKVDPTYDEEGYQIYKCVCGETARKDKVAKLPGKVTAVKCGADIGIAKKGSAKIVPVIDMLGETKYTVTYKSSDEKIATVNEKGEVTGIAIGKVEITCTVKDAQGNTVEDKVNVKVSYSLVQWILVAAEAIASSWVFVWDLILDALGLMK